jgi:hypothetical protein
MFTNVDKPWKEMKTYRCPCCGFKTLHGRGQDEICGVCFWQDDGQDEHDANEVRGGPNYNLSLTQARLNYKEYGASDRRCIPNVRAPQIDEL